MNTFRFSNLNMILMHFGILNFQTSQNLYTLLTINKGSSVFRTSSFSQISQDESAVCNFVKPGGNEIINSAENIPDIEEKQGKRNFNDIATFKGEWLEGEFVNSNVINLSRRSLLKSEISLLSQGLKFVPTASKIDRAKLITELEEHGKLRRVENSTYVTFQK